MKSHEHTPELLFVCCCFVFDFFLKLFFLCVFFWGEVVRFLWGSFSIMVIHVSTFQLSNDKSMKKLTCVTFSFFRHSFTQ